MNDSKKQVRRGSTLVMRIGDPDDPRTEGAAKAPSQGGGAFDDGADDELYAFRKKPEKTELNFYDLGTRLRSVPTAGTVFDGKRVREYQSQEDTAPASDRTSEYVEVRWEVRGVYDPGSNTMTITPEEHERLNRILLGSLAPSIPHQPDDVTDPTAFSTVNGSSRKVANCQQEMAGIVVVDGAQIVFDITERDPQPEDALERWNPDNVVDVSFGGRSAQGQVTYSQDWSDALEGKPLRVVFNAGPDSPFFTTGGEYANFDTDDLIRFKVTSAPSFAADEVSFQMAGNEGVYLRPLLGPPADDPLQFSAIRLGASYPGSDPFDLGIWVMRKFMRYPSSAGTLITDCQAATSPAFIDNYYACQYLRSLYSHLATFLAAHPDGSVDSSYDPLQITLPTPGPTIVNPLPAGSLVAIISREGAKFFVWRKTDLADVND